MEWGEQMANYGQVAINAVEYVKSNYLSPEEAWKKAALDVFPTSESSRNKACPKSTFLGLCEEDMIIDIPSGKYTRSKKNKEYALKAIKLLNIHPDLTEDKMKLWKLIVGDEKKHNYQMDVVLVYMKEG